MLSYIYYKRGGSTTAASRVLFFTMEFAPSIPYAHRLWAICGNECGRAPILKDGNARSPVRSQAFSGHCNYTLPFIKNLFFEEVHVVKHGISLI